MEEKRNKTDNHGDLFRPELVSFIDEKHERAQLAHEVDQRALTIKPTISLKLQHTSMER